jgi:hypothetical protein
MAALAANDATASMSASVAGGKNWEIGDGESGNWYDIKCFLFISL